MAPEVGGAQIDWADEGAACDYPLEADVRSGTVYANGTMTGTLSVPTPATGVSGSVDINAIKETIRYVLDTANAVGGDPIDLSDNLARRVKAVMKVNPEKLRPTANLFPVVTTFLASKSIVPKDIAVNQVNGRRKAVLDFKIVGMMWNDTIQNYKSADPADDDLEYLMENIEVVIRHYATLNNLCNWQFPSAVTYHSSGYDEQTHMRIGILDLQITVFY